MNNACDFNEISHSDLYFDCFSSNENGHFLSSRKVKLNIYIKKNPVNYFHTGKINICYLKAQYHIGM